VNTNKKIQKSTGYFIFLLKIPRLTEIQSAQIVALLEAGLSQSAVAIRMGINRSTVSRVLIWHEILQDSIRACINMQERLGEIIRRRAIRY